MIRVGPSGWSYPDWEGTVYTGLPRGGAHRLALIARVFDFVEINASFYRTPPPQHATSWVETVFDHPHFQFAAKLHQNFTHTRVYTAADVDAFHRFLDPLRASGRLAALLLQFPWSFRATAENWDYLRRIAGEFPTYPLVVEVRHSEWWKPRFFDLLREAGLSIANIDQPPLKDQVPPDEQLTGPLAYIRFHGRNAAHWWSGQEPYYGARYDYLYEPTELEPWVDRINRLSQTAQSTLVAMNNHHRGDAVVNGLELMHALGRRDIRIPPGLLAEHPHRLGPIGRPLGGMEPDLFETEPHQDG